MRPFAAILAALALVSAGPLAGEIAFTSPFASATPYVRPADIVILANSNDPESMELARFYAKKRAIPEANIAAFPMPSDADITFAMFVEYIHNPLNKWLMAHNFVYETDVAKDSFGRVRGRFSGNRVGYVVLCRGVPLRIADELSLQTPANIASFQKAVGLKADAPLLRSGFTSHSYASVDSEIAAMPAEVNPVVGFLPNPFFRKIQANLSDTIHILRTSRLDGPTLASAKGIVESAMQAERTGLDGRVYIDEGGGPTPAGDKWLESAAKAFSEAGWDVAVDRNKGVMPSDARFDAPAVYLGWYANGICGPFAEPGMRFPAGAVAVHIQSFSAASMRNGAVWVPGFVERGVAGTVGNVYEPTFILTQDLEVMSLALLGGWSFTDAAWASTPALSWQGVIIGDPLYRPFPWMSLLSTAPRPSAGPYARLAAVAALRGPDAEKRQLDETRAVFEAGHSPAAALALAKLLAAKGDADGAAKALAFFAEDAAPDAGRRSVALQAARELARIGRDREALAILVTLEKTGTSDAFRASVHSLRVLLESRSAGADASPAKTN